ncbi:MAG: cation diffusion facilitator family transporter [Actinomycetota bacterium]
MGRTHHTHEKVDRALEASDEGIRAVKISLLGLLATAILQLFVVAVSNSVALLSDTLHNFADAATALPLWLAFWLSRRPPNARYTYGYGRAEDIAGIFIVLVIAGSALLAGYEGISRLIDPSEVRNLPYVAVASIIGFAGNETVAQYRIRVGRRIGSAALEADGLHARTDGITSLGVLLGAGGVALGLEWADPAMGLLIAVAILLILKSAARDVYHRLMDATDPSLVSEVTDVLHTVDGVRRVDHARVRWIGHRLRAEVDVSVDDSLSVVEAHDIAEHAHHELLHRIPRLHSALIHVNPMDAAGTDFHKRVAHHFETGGARPGGGSPRGSE